MPDYQFKFGTINVAENLPPFSPELCRWIDETAERRVRAVLDAVVHEALSMAMAAADPSVFQPSTSLPPELLAPPKPKYEGPERRSILSITARESSFQTMNQSQREAWEVLQQVGRAENQNATPAVVYRDEGSVACPTYPVAGSSAPCWLQRPRRPSSGRRAC